MSPTWLEIVPIQNPTITYFEYRSITTDKKGNPKYGPVLGVIWTLQPDPDPEAEIWQAGIGSSICPGFHTQKYACTIVEKAVRLKCTRKRKKTE